MLSKEDLPYAPSALPKMYCLLSMWHFTVQIHQWPHQGHITNKLAENVACLSLVDMWPIFHPFVTPSAKASTLRAAPQCRKSTGTAPLRTHTDLYLDKQIDKQSTVFHYQPEKLTSSLNSRSEPWGGGGTKQYEFPIHSRVNAYAGILLIEKKFGGKY